MSDWLTPLQRRIVRLIELGYTYDEMGKALGFTGRTAKYHTDILRHRVGVKQKRQLPRALQEMGIDYRSD